jgi:hypothetical protein
MFKQHFAATTAKHKVKPEDLPNLSSDHPVIRARMALLNRAKWPDGHSLTCRFLDGKPEWQAKVREKAKIWETYANVNINFVEDKDAEVRISFFADDGSWSAVGNECMVTSYFSKKKPTMNFGWLRDDTADHEYERVVVHEFGHALGCEHEHQSPNEHLDWNKEAVYKTFSGPPNNWSKEDIDQNILQKYGPEGMSATIFDRKSIMLYQFDASLFRDHKGTPLNEHLSALDKSMIGRMYPRE